MSFKTALGCSLAALACAGAFALYPAAAQEEAGVWTKVASLPQARDEEQAAVVNGKIYLIGGAWDDVKDGKRDERYTDGFVTEYDPMTNTFRERSHGPEGLTHQGHRGSERQDLPGGRLLGWASLDPVGWRVLL